MSVNGRLVRDAEHLDAKLSKTDGSGDLGSYVVNLAKNKTIEKPLDLPQTESEKNTTDLPEDRSLASSDAAAK